MIPQILLEKSKAAASTELPSKDTGKLWTAVFVLFFILLVSSLISLIVGPVKIPFVDLISTIIDKVTGETSANSLYSSVLFSIRLPRIAAAILAGWALALAGLCYQSLLKNPLASEYTLGITSGAAIGAVVAALFQFHFPMSTPLFAFLGSAATMLIVFSVARSRFLTDTYSLVLTGIILTSFGNAVLSLLLSIISPNQLHAFFFWYMGSFAMAQWPAVLTITPFCCGGLSCHSVLQLGDECDQSE